MSWVASAVGLFAVTNLDDMVVLSLFFGLTHAQRRSPWPIVLGQYLGFLAILAVTVVVTYGTTFLPESTVRYLGLVPIAIGLRAAYLVWRDRDDDEPRLAVPSTWTVAGVTLANGGDNIAVYVAVFASLSAVEIAGYTAVFLALVAVWCLAGYWATRHHRVTSWIRRWGHVVYPVALILVGLYVLLA